jgi:hypothetical protein
LCGSTGKFSTAIPSALIVSGVNGQKIGVTGYVEIPLQMEDVRTGKVRTFTRPVLVLVGIEQKDLILGYDFIQEEGMIIDGAANETYFAERRADGGDAWRSASLCCLGRTTILPKTITHAVVGTVTQLGDRVQEGAGGLHGYSGIRIGDLGQCMHSGRVRPGGCRHRQHDQ